MNESLTIFYDGQCPLCIKEMEYLKRCDKNNLIGLVDIHQNKLMEKYPDIKFDDAMQILHAKYQNKIIKGLEVTYIAWSIVGKEFWVTPLKWPIIKPISNKLYLVFARNRYAISSRFAQFFGFKAPTCQSGACYDKSSDSNHRSK